MGSGAIICIPSLIKIGSGIQKLTERRGVQRHTIIQKHGQHGDRISLFQESRLKTKAFNRQLNAEENYNININGILHPLFT
jgi:hypothetical protein